jgi:CheY-like chemotaxis protein
LALQLQSACMQSSAGLLRENGNVLSILIVEDELVTRTALAALLSVSGYETEAVDSAEKALKLLSEGRRPEIALVDLDLPGMNGAEFISKLAQNEPTVFPVLITAAGKDRVSSLLDPGVKHLRKPVNFKELLQVIDGHVAGR